MKNNKKLFTLFGLVGLGLVAAATTTLTKGSLLFPNLATERVWRHYAETQGDEVSIGNKEYWIQCGTDTVSFTAPSGEVEEMSVGADTSGYSFHDDRFTTSPKAYSFSYPDSLVGASIVIPADNNDVTWVLNGNVTANSISFKTYDNGKAFKNTFPRVNFNYYEEVKMDLSTTIWNEGYKFGFDEDVATTGMAPAISVKTGGKLSLIRVNDTTVRMIIKHPNANMDLTHDFVGKEYVTGEKGVYFYTLAKGDAFFKVENWAPSYSHTHSNETEASTTAIAAVKETCTVCGNVSKSLPTVDFTENKYGACSYNYTAESDYATSLMQVTSTSLSYKSYDVDHVFSYTLPRIKFSDFATTTISLSSENWYERIGFGFTQEEAATRENHTTYGGSKTGTLKFVWAEDTLNVQFSFEYVTLNGTVTDADVISGQTGFSLYSTSGYDRFLTFQNFTFVLK